jgi:hypothetical protein
METIIRYVREIEADERRVLEHVIGRRLEENQKVIIQVATAEGQLVEEPEQQPLTRPGKLPEWCNVYQGLTEEQIADVEEVILQRTDLARPSQ